MVAEYQPATGKYYYYTTDQINSTRVVTDDEGNVVYSAVHDPYGGVQQTWVNTFNPGWKFSGKEQDAESGLYYFGARYYDPTLYRFLSPDPAIPSDRAIYNPQRWNLYGYCLGNPINYVDMAGEQAESSRKLIITRTISGPTGTFGRFKFEGKYITIEGETLELPWRNNINYISRIPEGEYEAILHYWDDRDIWALLLQDTGSRKGIYIHEGNTTKNTKGCPLIGQRFDNQGRLSGGRALREAITADYLIDQVLSAWFNLDRLSRTVQKATAKIERGEVYSEWAWIGFTLVINGVQYYFYF
ncbi:MAG: DUF5675 family protein [Candidatus Saccharicenans sp.]|nr:DUF5675 family protein [Candidatus Saccharicenans sp.]